MGGMAKKTGAEKEYANQYQETGVGEKEGCGSFHDGKGKVKSGNKQRVRRLLL